MPASSDIYGQIQQPRQRNMLADYANIQQIQQGQTQNEFARMRMDGMQREAADQNRLREILSGTDPSMLSDALVKGGFLKQAQEYDSGQREKKAGALAHDKGTYDLAAAKADRYKKGLGALLNDPSLSKDLVMQTGQMMVSEGTLTPEVFAKTMQGMPDDVGQIRERLRQGIAMQMTPEQMVTVFAPKPTQVDNGQTIQTIDQNPNSPTYGQQTGAGSIQKQATPGEVMTDARTRSEGAANRGVTLRGQNMTDARARLTADLKVNQDGAAKVRDAKEVLSLLDEVDALLPKSTGSYTGAGIDVVANALGKSMPGAEAIAQLKALQGALVSKMPKMSGPQSDKDVLLYREMAGQIGDSTIPVPQRQAAAAMIRKLNEKYAGMAPGSSRPPAPAGEPQPSGYDGKVIDFKDLR